MALLDSRVNDDCVAASKSALLRATQAEAALGRLRVEVTQKIGHLTNQVTPSSVSGLAETPEIQSSVAVATTLCSQFDNAVAITRGSVEPQHWPGVETMLLSIAPVYNQLARQYAISATQNEILRTEVNALRRELQNAVRRAPDGRGDWPRIAPPFPQTLTALPGVLPIAIIDVGAQLLDSEGHVYAPLQATGHAQVTGFEPLDASRERRQAAEASTRMLPHFIGDGRPATFYVTEFDPSSSTFEPNLPFLERFVALSKMCRPIRSYLIETTPLDSIPDIGVCDYLKLDVQGGELAVLRGARRLLNDVLFVHSEVEFGPVYKDQPLFADIDPFLRAEGFELIDLQHPGYSGHSALPSRPAESRLLWSDAIYARESRRLLGSLDPSALIRAAYIAHVNYCMYDVAAEYIAEYDHATGSSYLRNYAVLFD
ncbi:MAG: FkbM family methyltransferase [Gammaproteobacteria bacterium]